MGRHSRTDSTQEIDALSNPVVAATSLGVHVHENGDACVVWGNMGMASKRMVFEQGYAFDDVHYTAGTIAMAACRAADINLADHQLEPW